MRLSICQNPGQLARESVVARIAGAAIDVRSDEVRPAHRNEHASLAKLSVAVKMYVYRVSPGVRIKRPTYRDALRSDVFQVPDRRFPSEDFGYSAKQHVRI